MKDTLLDGMIMLRSVTAPEDHEVLKKEFKLHEVSIEKKDLHQKNVMSEPSLVMLLNILGKNSIVDYLLDYQTRLLVNGSGIEVDKNFEVPFKHYADCEMIDIAEVIAKNDVESGTKIVTEAVLNFISKVKENNVFDLKDGGSVQWVVFGSRYLCRLVDNRYSRCLHIEPTLNNKTVNKIYVMPVVSDKNGLMKTAFRLERDKVKEFSNEDKGWIGLQSHYKFVDTLPVMGLIWTADLAV